MDGYELINKALKIFKSKKVEQYDVAVEILNKLGKKKNPNAIYQLGLLFKQGIYFDKSIEKSLNYFSLASQLGLEEASFELGEYYFNMSKFVISKRYFLKANHIGKSYYYLGLIEERGLIDNISFHRAFEYYLKGSKYKDTECIKRTAYFYEHGVGIKRNLEKSNLYLNSLSNK